jgi:two-component system NtrC family sensor kinase
LLRTREGVQRVAAIVAGMRGLARTGPSRMEPARVVDLSGGAVELVRNRLRRSNIALEVACDSVPSLVCVPPQISQVVLNLLLNAAQAVEESGRREGGLVKLSTAKEGKMLVLSIADNGAGIEADHMDRLFDPFFTTKPVGEGTGLGLSICHGIVSGHGGRIEVASRPGAGTTFRVYLPLTHESGELARTTSEPLEAPRP